MSNETLGPMRRIDKWIGKTIFHPPIISICQRLKVSQYFIHRTSWFAAALLIFKSNIENEPTLFSIIFCGLACVIFMLRAALTDDATPSTTTFYFRMFLIIVLPLVILREDVIAIIGQILMITAEYAATIINIPPTKNRSKNHKFKEAKI